MGSEKEKVCWDLKATECFIIACLEQVTNGEWLGTSFTKKGWFGIANKFKELTRKVYEKTKFKNRFDNLRREWRIWYKLFGKETGLGWDNVKNTVDANDEWWERKQLESPLYIKFRNKGLMFAHNLTVLFKDVVANGEYEWSPSSRVLPLNLGVDMNDVYRPSLEGIFLDVKEGSGDSEDASVGATNALGGINLNDSQKTISQGIGSQKSGEKRKRSNHIEKFSKKKTTTSVRIADVVSVLVDTCMSRNEVIATTSIQEVVNELKTLPELENDDVFHTQCCNLMLFKPARGMFVALRGLDEKRMHWLRDAVKNPLLFKGNN
ncbi:L10-interacting MYB domain-containing protein-like [Cajanus cajan]|uniref:L10-interacting MYB domain-containing protein-like n=1 Tax=Cajanus cajan TaxID=3821 RepID=UPI00098DACE5|nr:L10-interacting MYB domain-containing protein-like [Cajanus cajan]